VHAILPLSVIASLVLALAQAPFYYTHAHDPAHTHAPGLPHAHFPEHHHDHEGDHPANHDLAELDHQDAAFDVQLLDWLAGDGAKRVKPFLASPAIIVAPQLVTQATVADPPAPHYHDPPWRLSLHPRAPPA